ncbi:MAG: DNA polymerase IV [Lentisphaerae bacterium]|nr:DNA polymerase IV [Lentisphaerota bacterium]
MEPATPFSRLDDFPRAIVHFDGDAFFASVEQALDPSLKGRPLVTGKERGIIACASYEAKKRGIKRGVALWEAQRMCPDLVVLPSDYETYSLYSKRMFDIVRRFTPMVEEYSIDEGFADLTGLRRLHQGSYAQIARAIQAAVRDELDLGISVGLSLSKSLAKLASKFRKPAGFTPVAGRHIHLFLQRRALADVWGFGPNTVALLQKHGMTTPYDFVVRPQAWADRWMGKIGRELWSELRGDAVYPVTTEEKSSFASVSKCKTFTAPETNPDYVYAKLVRNVESAFIKLRRHKLRARVMAIALRRQDFDQQALGARLSRPTSATHEVLPLLRPLFDAIAEPGAEYRGTMVLLERLEADAGEQLDLFEDRLSIDAMQRASRAIDAVNALFGKHRVALGTSLFLSHHRRTARDEAPRRKTDLLPGETARRRLHLPKMLVRV